MLVLVACGLLRGQPQCDAGAVFSGPITITAGGTYSGNWQSADLSVPAVSINTTAPVTIVNSRLKGPGDLIDALETGSQLTVRNSCFVGTNPNISGQRKGNPIHTYQAASLTVQNCDFESGGYYGIYVQGYGGDSSANDTIKILNNRIHNADGRLSDGSGGYLTDREGYAHAIILNNVHGVGGIEIGWNQIINEPYQSGGNIDLIDIYESSGTATSPMQVHDNYLQGSYAADPANANGLHLAGSGFTTDGTAQTDPSVTTSFLKVHDNQAVSMGNGGINIAIGHDIEMYANRIVSHGQLSDGTNYTTAYAAGMDHWDYQYPPPAAPPANFGNNSVHDNLVGLRRLRNGAWERSDYYIPVAPAVQFNNLSWPNTTADAPTLADEGNELLRWEQKLAANNVSVGSNLVSPPVTTAGANPLPNAGGWNNSDVTVMLNAQDSQPGGAGIRQITLAATGAQTIASTVVAGGAASVTIAAEGITTLTFFATDNFGNVEPLQTLTIKVDKTPPAVTGTGSPTANSFGWNNTNVTVSFTGADSLSGINSCTAPITLASEGAGQTVSGTCTDNAGNVSSPATVTANIEKTPPRILQYLVLFGSQSYNLIGSPRNRLPWAITGIQVTFSRPMVTGGIASLGGLSAARFTGLGTNTLTWTFSPVLVGSFAAVLAGSGANALTDIAGNALGGGSGSTQALRVLWGDFNDDGGVSSADLVGVNNATKTAYNIFADMNGDGAVNFVDVTLVRSRIGAALP